MTSVSTEPWSILSAEADLEELLGVSVRLVEGPGPKLRKAIEKDGVAFDFRDRAVHRYDALAPRRLYAIAKVGVPALAAAIQTRSPRAPQT